MIVLTAFDIFHTSGHWSGPWSCIGLVEHRCLGDHVSFNSFLGRHDSRLAEDMADRSQYVAKDGLSRHSCIC